MLRLTMNPILIRFTLWLVAAMVAVSAFLFWGGGFTRLLECINDIF